MARLGRTFILVTAVSLWLGHVSPAIPAAHASEQATCVWHNLPLPAEASEAFEAVVEPGGVLWIRTHQGLFHWDGQAFVPPTVLRFQAPDEAAALFGGPDRGAYFTKKGDREYQGKLYRLLDDAQYVTDFYYERPHWKPDLYVAKSAAIYNWGVRYLGVYSGGQWHKHEVKLGAATAVFDMGRTVYFWYGDRIYTLDAKGNLTEDILPADFPRNDEGRSARAIPWGEHRMVFFRAEAPGICGYDLASHTQVNMEAVNRAIGRAAIHTGLREPDGSVRLYADGKTRWTSARYRLSPEGQVSTLEESAGVVRGSIYYGSRAGPFLNASDGSSWLAAYVGRVTRSTADGEQVFGWREGVPYSRALQLAEGLDGTIYLVSEAGIYAYDPKSLPTELPAGFARWQSFDLVERPPIRDAKGGLWMFLSSHPNEASYWDGEQWHHVPVPFDTRRIQQMMADDRGHLLTSAGTGENEGNYDVAPGGVRKFQKFGLLLEHAVRSGARRIEGDRQSAGCQVLDGNTIWYGSPRQPSVSHFDGGRWDALQISGDVAAVLESARWGILIRSQEGRFFSYRQGQIVEADFPAQPPSKWLLGPHGFQPFEAELLQEPARVPYVVVEGELRNAWFVPRARAEGERREARRGQGPPEISHTDSMTPSLFGGCWLDNVGQNEGLGRVFGDKLFACNLAGTPLVGSGSVVRRILEDSSHNLWFECANRVVFVKRLDDFRIRALSRPRYAEKSVVIDVEPLPRDLKDDTIRLFWRLNGGPWQGGETRRSVAVVHFPEPGEHEVEILGMDPQGGTTTETLKLNIRSTPPKDEPAG